MQVDKNYFFKIRADLVESDYSFLQSKVKSKFKEVKKFYLETLANLKASLSSIAKEALAKLYIIFGQSINHIEGKSINWDKKKKSKVVCDFLVIGQKNDKLNILVVKAKLWDSSFKSKLANDPNDQAYAYLHNLNVVLEENEHINKTFGAFVLYNLDHRDLNAALKPYLKFNPYINEGLDVFFKNDLKDFSEHITNLACDSLDEDLIQKVSDQLVIVKPESTVDSNNADDQAEISSSTIALTKGHHLKGILFLDVETANYNRNSICQISIRIYEGDKEIVNYTSLVKPHHEDTFEIMFTGIHGINWKTVEQEKTFDQVWLEIADYFNQDYLVICHNAPFDIGCLKATINKYNLSYQKFYYSCTLSAFKKIYLESKNHQLSHLAQLEGFKFNHHDASQDTLVLAKIFFKNFANLEAYLKLCHEQKVLFKLFDKNFVDYKKFI